ncbi:MAG TPA: phosphate/phosphite/phosphonate ABC transporter substrate-binding protein [Gammaproteobacteria bacterium]
MKTCGLLLFRCLVLLPLIHAVGVSAGEPPLSLGVVPVESPVSLLKRYAGLRDQLASSAGRPVVVETAPDNIEFVRRCAQGRYDIVLTGPHLALLAAESGHYQVRLVAQPPLTAQVVIARNGTTRTLADLSGRRVAIPPQHSLIALVGRHYLGEQGLTGAQEPAWRVYHTHNAAVQAVLAGEADAAVVNSYTYARLRNTGMALRSLGGSATLPGLAVLFAERMPAAQRDALVEGLLGLSASPLGRERLATAGMEGFSRATSEDFEPARKYLEGQPWPGQRSRP